MGMEGEAVEDQRFLMEVMAVREELEDAESEEVVAEVKRKNEERIKACESVVGGLLERGDWEGARREVERWRYWEGIKEAVGKWGE